jgi:HlyD family secretion protein
MQLPVQSSPAGLPAVAASQAVVLDDEPRREIRWGLMVLGGFTALFVGWSALTPLDAAAIASGQISVSGHSQIVQHREGGVVATVDVKEGQQVKAGQILVELAPEDVGAQEKSLRAQLISLRAQRARLTTELQGLPHIQWPEDFAGMTGDDLAAANEAMRSQQAQFDAGIGALRSQQAMSVSKAASLAEQAKGGQSQLESVTRQQGLIEEELKGVRDLASKGFASQTRIRALERSREDLVGSRGQLSANIASYREQIGEARLQSSTVERQRREAAANQMRETEDQINNLTPKYDSARRQLERGTLRSQTDGVVTGLSVFAPGSVVAPGQKLMEVVPKNPVLVISAKVPASEIEGLHVGQKTEVRFMSTGARTVPILAGSLTRLSADSFQDEKSGAIFYTAEVTVPKGQLDMVRRLRGADSEIRPGVPVQVTVPLHKRTAFEYLFEPLSQALWTAFRQK